MLIRLVEIYEENASFDSDKLRKQFFLREIYVNKSYVVSFREDIVMINNYVQGKLYGSFDKDQKFTLITLNKGSMGHDISVLGSVEYIHKVMEKLNASKA